MRLRSAGRNWTTHRPDTVLVPLATPQHLPAACGPALRDTLAHLLHQDPLAAHPGEFRTLSFSAAPGVRRVVTLGVGRNLPPPAMLHRLAGMAGRRLRQLHAGRIALLLPDAQLLPDRVAIWASELIAGGYRFTTFRPDEAGWSPQVVVPGLPPASVRALAEGAAIGESLNRVRDLANLPGNEAPPRAVARFARAQARRLGLRCEVWSGARLEREGCRTLLAVGQGSAEPPCMIRLEYRPRGARGRPVVVVGKTITFDSGGLSLKPAKSMEWMRYDKSGGMAVLALFEMLGRLRPALPHPVVGILAAAENMPGGRATRPGDIVRTRAGLTVEIMNTDAEGRLVLADALDVACDLKPAAVVNLATLTGAAVTAVGRLVSAIMGNRDTLVNGLRSAGEATGERLWPLPLYPEYGDLLRSPFADMKNIGDGSAGTFVGGMFLRRFVAEGVPWAHIDLTHAWEEQDTPHAPAGANLFGARLLLEWLLHGPHRTA